MIAFSNAAIEKARLLSQTKQNVIRVGTSLLRSCKPLVDLWAGMEKGHTSFQLRIVPFDDHPTSLNFMRSQLGSQIDCFVGPCDTIDWKKRYNVLLYLFLALSHRRTA